MKTLISFALSLLLYVAEQGGGRVVLVVATNPIFPAPVVAVTLPAAVAEAKNMAFLDPVCFAVPEVCQARLAMTVFHVTYTDHHAATLSYQEAAAQ